LEPVAGDEIADEEDDEVDMDDGDGEDNGEEEDEDEEEDDDEDDMEGDEGTVCGSGMQDTAQGFTCLRLAILDMGPVWSECHCS
jgi:hypothetical protein